MSGAQIMVDIDDVIFPMIESVHAVALELGLHDGTRPLEQWKGWEQYCVPEARFWEVWGVFRDRGGYVETAPIPGAVEAIAHAAMRGHYIHLVTARGFVDVPGAPGELVREWTVEWLAHHGVSHDTLTFAQDKVAAQADLGIRFDGAFDDRPVTVAALRADGVNAFLVDQPHNRIDPLANGLPRVESLAEALSGPSQVVYP